MPPKLTITACHSVLHARLRACTTHGLERTVYHTRQGQPDPQTRLIGERLYELGGEQAMREACLSLRNALGYQAGDEIELKTCWRGIGKWPVEVRR